MQVNLPKVSPWQQTLNHSGCHDLQCSRYLAPVHSQVADKPHGTFICPLFFPEEIISLFIIEECCVLVAVIPNSAVYAICTSIYY